MKKMFLLVLVLAAVVFVSGCIQPPQTKCTATGDIVCMKNLYTEEIKNVPSYNSCGELNDVSKLKAASWVECREISNACSDLNQSQCESTAGCETNFEEVCGFAGDCGNLYYNCQPADVDPAKLCDGVTCPEEGEACFEGGCIPTEQESTSVADIFGQGEASDELANREAPAPPSMPSERAS